MTKTKPNPNSGEILEQVNDKHGKGALMRMGDDSFNKDVEVISTRVPGLDIALGIGGLPKGRIVEIYGPEAGGKTTLALQVLAECQSQGKAVAFIDAEHAIDPVYVSSLGVDIDNLLISQPDCGEDALELVDTLVQTKKVDLVIVDSVAALVPKRELEGDMGDSHVGLHPRLMSQACRKLTGHISKSNTCVIFINQLRNKVGLPPYMNPEVPSGGVALKFYASVRMDVRRVNPKIEDAAKNQIGTTVRIKVVKNKLASPFKNTDCDMIFGKGISRLASLIDVAVKQEIIIKKAAAYSMGSKPIARGRDALIKKLESDTDLANKILEKVYAGITMPSKFTNERENEETNNNSVQG